MDPLSLTVSVVALMTTAVQTVRGLEKLRRAFGAQEKLLELFNEVADLRALFFVVHEIVIRNDTEEAPIKAISQVLDRAYVLLEDLNSLIHQILKPTGPQETSRLSRRAWLLQEGRLLQLRDSLRDLRNRLNIGISAFTSSEIPQIRLHLNDLSISTSAMAAQQSDIYDQINHQATILQEVQSLLHQLSTPLTSNTLNSSPVSGPTSVTIECEDRERRLSQASTITPSVFEDSNSNTFCVKASVHRSRRCPRSCNCQCHSSSHLKAPKWMSNTLGLLFMGYSGVPLLSRRGCNNGRCRGSERSSMHVSYYFPSWLVARMIDVNARWSSQCRPSMSLRVMRVLPDDAPLFGYVRQGDIPSVQSLFRQGLASPIDVAASDGRSVLHIAIYAGQPKTARFLIDQNADCEYEDKYFHSPVGACWEMTFQKVPTLPTCIVGESTEDIDFLDGREFTILHKIVLGIASIPLSEHLDFSNADINAKDAMGQTALHWASVRGDLEAIEILLASGADPNLLSDAHWSPLHHAAISAVPGTLEPLLRESAKVDELNNRGHTALSIAALVHDDPDFLNPLYRFGADVHSSNHSGQTSLHRAALRDNVSTARWLIDRGVDVNQPDKMGYTALHQCIRSGSHKTLALLLNAGCHTDMQASDARTILHDAAAHGDLKMLSILCEASLDSIDIEVKDSEGMRAEEIFEMLRHQHQEESDNERLESMRTFDSLLQKLKRYQQRPGNAAFDFATASPELALEVDEFLDAAERMESSQGTGSLETSVGSLILADNGLAEGASQLTLQVKSG